MLNSRGTAPVEATASAEHLTLAWFAKRSVLWALIVAIGIGAACGLYAVAGEPGDAAASGSSALVKTQPSG
jgi:hypothetical protein